MKANELDPERRPHRAMRAIVRSHGQEAPQTLYEAFDIANRHLFEGKLGTPMILIAHPSSPRTAGDYFPRDVHGLVSRIRIAPASFRWGWVYAFGTLLHEMIHAYQHEVLQDSEDGYRGHGPLFSERANAIGAVFGFPPVAYRGRGGLARAEIWPELPPDALEPDTRPRRPRLPPPVPLEDPGDDEQLDDGAGVGGDRARDELQTLARAAYGEGLEDGTQRERERIVRLINAVAEAHAGTSPAYRLVRLKMFEVARKIGEW